MARTYLSVLTEDSSLRLKLIHTIRIINYAIGYAGENEHKLIDYFKQNSLANHILYIKPSSIFRTAFSEAYLKKFAHVQVVVIGQPLSVEQTCLIQTNIISAYIVLYEITPKIFKEIIKQLKQQYYYANNQVPETYWNKQYKISQHIPIPNFTKREAQILIFLCHGFTSTDIAQLIQTSISNVNNHVERIKLKLMAHSTNEVITICLSNNWIHISKEHFKRHNPYVGIFTTQPHK